MAATSSSVLDTQLQLALRPRVVDYDEYWGKLSHEIDTILADPKLLQRASYTRAIE